MGPSWGLLTYRHLEWSVNIHRQPISPQQSPVPSEKKRCLILFQAYKKKGRFWFVTYIKNWIHRNKCYHKHFRYFSSATVGGRYPTPMANGKQKAFDRGREYAHLSQKTKADDIWPVLWLIEKMSTECVSFYDNKIENTKMFCLS